MQSRWGRLHEEATGDHLCLQLHLLSVSPLRSLTNAQQIASLNGKLLISLRNMAIQLLHPQGCTVQRGTPLLQAVLAATLSLILNPLGLAFIPVSGMCRMSAHFNTNRLPILPIRLHVCAVSARWCQQVHMRSTKFLVSDARGLFTIHHAY